MSTKGLLGFLVRYINWLYFLAGIVLASGKISLIDDLAKLFGDWSTAGYLIVGLGIMLFVEIMGELIPGKKRGKEEEL